MTGHETAIAVMMGLTATAGLFAYYAFKLRDSQVTSNQQVAVFLAIVSLAFTNMLFYTTYLVVQNTPELAYLNNGFLNPGLLIMTWTTNGLLAYMLAAGIWTMIKYLMESFTRGMKSRGGGGDRDE